MNRAQLLCGGAVAVLALCGTTPAEAGSAPSVLAAAHRTGQTAAAPAVSANPPLEIETSRTFNVPAGSLAGALTAFARQSNVQLLYSADLVAGRRSAGLTGVYSPSQALDRLLRDTGLIWSETRPGVLLLRRAGAQANLDEPAIEVDEVIVTGTLVRGVDTASPVITLDRDALDSRGMATAADVLTSLPQNYSGSGTVGALLTAADGAGSNSALATGVNLRGLGPDATLLLVNGRRLAGTGSRGEFADASALPSAAVERVDVLLDGASALYGSDAVAGVVNIILRRGFDGHESRLRLSAARGGAEEVQLSHLMGARWPTGSALLAVEWQKQNALNASDRDFTRNGDLRPFGGSDWRDVFASPGNIVAFDPDSASYVSRWAIRPGPDGVARTPADFAAGETNLTGVARGVDLVPEQKRTSLYARLVQSLGDRLDLSADVRFSHRDYSFANIPAASLLTVTAANPHFVSPEGAASHRIAYSWYGDVGPTRNTGVSRSLGITGGGALSLGDWTVDGYLAWAEERGERRLLRQIQTTFLAEVLGNVPDNPLTAYSPARDGWFNPFGSGEANAPALLDLLTSGFTRRINRSRTSTANLLAEGPLFALPGGALRLAVGGQFRQERFGQRSLSFTSGLTPRASVRPERERSIGAVFAEASLPLFGETNSRPGLHRLELSLAARHERYDDVGSTTDPKVGVIWSPAEPFQLRATWGTSFRAPALVQVFDDVQAGATLLPQPGGAQLLAAMLYGGNRDLKPETAETFTAGMDWGQADGPRVSLSYFDTRFENRIAQPVNENPSLALVDPSLAPFVQLVDPSKPGDLALIEAVINAPYFQPPGLFPASDYRVLLDSRWVNTATVQVRGLDFDASWPVSVGAHDLTFTLQASHVLDYLNQTTPTAPVENLVGYVRYPVSWRGRAGVDWTHGDLGAGLYWNHAAAYRDRLERPIEAWNTFDLNLRWSPASGPLGGLQLVASVRNLLDRDPPFHDSPLGFGFDPGQADLLGRVAALQLIRRW